MDLLRTGMIGKLMPDDALLELHHQLEKVIELLAIKDPTAATRPIDEV